MFRFQSLRRNLFLNKVTGSLNNISKRNTTILCVRKDGRVCIAGDGQVSLGPTVIKGNARKVRRIGEDGNVVAGFAGSTADAMALLDRLEKKLEEHPGQLFRACVELAKAWRTEKYLRNLEATMIVADAHMSFEITGNGDVLEPQKVGNGDVLGIGSGGNYALSAALAMMDRKELTADEIVAKAMKIAGDICVYTNHTLVVEHLSQEMVSLDVGQNVEDDGNNTSDFVENEGKKMEVSS